MREIVLVVDDDDDVRSLYRRQLTARGYRVSEATTLEEAFEKVATAHVVVLDLDLPDGSGTAVLDALSRDRDAPPVIVCSSSVYAGRVARRYHATALPKFGLTAVANEVDRLLGDQRRSRPSRVSGRPERDSRMSMS